MSASSASRVAPRQAIGAPPWAADGVEARPLAELLPYAANARVHSAEQVRQIAASITEYGFVNPVIVDERGEIIAGHGRVMAARSLGLDTVPVIVRPGLTETQKRGLRLADNKIALNSTWDETLLAKELAALGEEGALDLSLTGFKQNEIEDLMAFAEDQAGDADAGSGQAGGVPKSMVRTAEINPTFWISVEGPFASQAEASSTASPAAARSGSASGVGRRATSGSRRSLRRCCAIRRRSTTPRA